ncbi:MAG: M48 family peptidase, partial [Proteobacteria bacterium]|nr:M48 family peptidase [Pseudomonadota bacterium]
MPLADGQMIPVLGNWYRIRHVGGRGVVQLEGDEIHVPGEAAFVARRLREWLKAWLKKEIVVLA